MFCSWMMNMPPDRHPLLDNAAVSEHQTGFGHDGVWFIDTFIRNINNLYQGSLHRVDTTRYATVPRGTAFLFAVEKTAWDTTGDNNPTEKADTAQLFPQVRKTLNDRRTVQQQVTTAEIDGYPVSNLDGYLTSPVLTPVVMADSNFFDPALAGAHFNQASAGVYLFIDSLSPGTHVFHVQRTSTVELCDIYYRITVQ